MADNVRVIVIGESAAEFSQLKTEFLKLSMAAELCADKQALDKSFESTSKPVLVACFAPLEAFKERLEVACQIKKERPFLAVILYSTTVREVLRLRCIEEGLDECVARPHLTETAAFLAKIISTIGTEATLEDVKATASPESRQGQMFFQLKGDELGNALQFLCMTSRKGRLSLKFDTGQSGAIFVAGGTVKHAEFEDFEGIRAISKMLRGGAMEARFFEGRETPKTSSERPISSVLIEASVMADEEL